MGRNTHPSFGEYSLVADPFENRTKVCKFYVLCKFFANFFISRLQFAEYVAVVTG